MNVRTPQRSVNGAPGTSGVTDVASLASSLARWGACDVADLAVPELDAMIAVTERGVSWLRALHLRANVQRTKLLEAGGPKPSPDDPRPSPKPLPKPGRSRREQASDLRAARAIELAPSFGDALESGEISFDHLAALGRVRHLKHVPAHEAALLTVARTRTAEDFAAYLRSWDAARDLDDGVDRATRQHTLRRMSFNRDLDGMGTMFAALAPLAATKVENTIRQIANELYRAGADDGTTMSQRLADAFVVMADRAVGGADATKATRPTLVVICDETSLRGRLDHAGLGFTLDGEPVPAAELRRLACDANILPAVMGGAGHVLDFGRIRRRATEPQRLALLTMYGGCVIDGCSCPTALIDIHHSPEWQCGGRTDLATMLPLCGPDHTRSHAEGWIYQHHPNGAVTITTSQGVHIPTRRPRKPDPERFRPPPDTRAAPRGGGEPHTANLPPPRTRRVARPRTRPVTDCTTSAR